MENIVLITGASSGIGKATAKLLLAKGCKVYAGARRVENLKELEYLGGRIMPLDVTDEESLKKAVAMVMESASPSLSFLSCANRAPGK